MYKMPKYCVSMNNVQIIDSWEVPKNDFQEVLDRIKHNFPECDVWKRCPWTLRMEWATHNFLYRLHILRSHTKDVDLNYPQRWVITAAYCLVGMAGWLFIK